DNSGNPVAGVTLTLTNTSTGGRFAGTSRDDGRYAIENVAVGGPYVLEARRIGFRPARIEGIAVTLGQAVAVDLTLEAAAAELEPVTVVATREDPLRSLARTGAATFISDTAVARLPTLNRNFTDFIALSPQVSSTASNNSVAIGGQQNRLSNIQIDGASDNDLFGLGHTGQPGGQVQAKSITLEALREYQVITAPFDVRQSGFGGGLINAITKSGTNQIEGSAFWYWQSDRLVGTDTAGIRFGQYLENQRGLSLGGPIVRDRLHFFAAAEWQQRAAPNTGATIGRETPTVVGIAADSAQRLVNTLQNTWGAAAGSYGAFTVPTANRNFFGRLD